MANKKPVRLYLNEAEAKVVSLALISYQDYCGEVIGDYKDNRNKGFTPSEHETQDYNDSLERHELARHILSKLH